MWLKNIGKAIRKYGWVIRHNLSILKLFHSRLPLFVCIFPQVVFIFLHYCRQSASVHIFCPKLSSVSTKLIPAGQFTGSRSNSIASNYCARLPDWRCMCNTIYLFSLNALCIERVLVLSAFIVPIFPHFCGHSVSVHIVSASCVHIVSTSSIKKLVQYVIACYHIIDSYLCTSYQKQFSRAWFILHIRGT
jgi:hypothetical protein